MTRKRKEQLRLLRSIIEGSLIVLVLAVFIILVRQNSYEAPIELNDKWDIIYQKKLHTYQNPTAFSFPGMVHRGEAIIMRRTIPKDNYARSSVCFTTYLSAVSVRLGGRQIYTSGMEEFMTN